jgi:hypothetical protein
VPGIQALPYGNVRFTERLIVDSKLLPLVLGLVLATVSSTFAQQGTDGDSSASLVAQEQFYMESVLPILERHCFECHSHVNNAASGGLVLDSLASMQVGGARGAAVVAGNVESVLMQALHYEDVELQMPPDGKLPLEQIAAIERWIRDGAIVPEAMRGDVTANSGDVIDIAATHWAYQPPVGWPSPEACKESFYQENLLDEQCIDQIVLTKLNACGLSMSPVAPRATLARRMYYDLVGLPPTIEQLRAIEQDQRSHEEVMTELVDELLASEHFGERWARYWMDISRYADNKGYVFQEDREYPGAFRYRDWLIRAFNNDMPYDEFVTRQLAADLISHGEGAEEHLPALGFLTLGRRFLNNKHDITDDRLDVLSRGLMGMTLACARCHDHKYDPISQADYYSMAGIFMNTDEPGGEPWPHRLQDAAESRPSFILIRGSPGNRGDQVPRRFVQFLSSNAQTYDSGSGRLELAREITSSNNPLTGRVIANRIWMQLMGSSLVESPSDLGTRCPPPDQLELLDHLAISLMDDGWSMKRLIRRIVLSKTYQQQSYSRPDAVLLDPENRLYWKANRRRLDFEAYRDTLLSRAGLLDRSVYGPSASISGRSLMPRRTVYAYIDRQNLPSIFRTFDFASPDTHSPQRPLTSVPQQGLFVMNSDFMAHLARALEEQVSGSAASSDEHELCNSPSAIAAGVQQMFCKVLGRDPNDEELQLGVEFISSYQAGSVAARPELWQCGYGSFDPEQNRLERFKVLPHFEPGKWQGGPTLPDERLGWCLLTVEGGHAGNDLAHAVVRRWIAPRDGMIRVRGKLKHGSAEGDGVRGTLLAGGESRGQWMVHHSEESTEVENIAVEQGDFVDFVTDCRGGPSHDSFAWTVRIRYTDGGSEEFHSRHLPEPRVEALGVWAQFAQCLLSTNELAFVD